MKKIELLFKEFRRNTAITYDEFISAGWSTNEFLEYVRICEVIRSGFVFGGSLGKVLPQDGSVNTSGIFEAVRKSLQHELLDLAKWLHQYMDCELERLRIDQEMINHVYYIIHKEMPIIYLSNEDFRYELERLINIKLNKDLARIIGDDLNDISDAMIGEAIKERREIINSAMEPKEPDYNSYSAIQKWASLEEEYENISDLEEEIEEFEEYLEERKKSLKNNTKNNTVRVFNQNEHILYIYAGSYRCLTEHIDMIEDVRAEISSIYGQPIRINVHYCPKCGYYFIKGTEYDSYKDKYKFLPIRMKYKGNAKDDNGFNRNDYSFMSLAGYTVRKKDGVPRDIRRKILVKLIDIGCSKYEIIKHLDMLIETNGYLKNMGEARKKWQEDLEYIRQYDFENQRVVEIKSVRDGSPL